MRDFVFDGLRGDCVLMRFIQQHRFTVFGWYRVALGGIVLVLWVVSRL